ncbi:hypothetical protein FNF29_00502 [Cafeteria roenbergensis]|uniref:DNA mismatch repair proteins mutS family domain-containing protein n=1 Tax=Cafeteria roenbergensis TaxID=33653 RepID=A0A5A8CY76_CAFRO|nr:hypothetical protein FNF29_00502 [Cafeteria roenbergensis]|eukprot:KAA0157150.1 hypothetical protein FNF29_00502 [Cafeteria roenbergensis]
MDFERPTELRVFHLEDGPAYSQLLALLHLLEPESILVPAGSERATPLVSAIESKFRSTSTPTATVPRRAFTADVADTVVPVCGDTAAAELLVREMPLAAASAAAVLRRLEALLLVHFHRRSIRLVRAWQSGRMHIDYRSVAELELLRSKRDGKTDGTLLAVLDRTCTRIGKRALLADVLSPPCSTDVLPASAIDKALEEDAGASTSGIEMRQNECFAIRAGLNPDLDIVRQLYVKNVEDAAALADEYRDKWDMPSLKLHVTTARGYHLSAPAAATARMPAEAIQAVQAGTRRPVFFTTHHMAALNSRIDSNLASIYAMTEHILVDVYGELRSHVWGLHACADAVRELDVLQSLAAVWAAAPSTESLSMPIWLDPPARGASRSLGMPWGTLDTGDEQAGDSRGQVRVKIRQARHPVLDQCFSAPVVPNDVSLGGSDPRVMIVSGPNGSGKSTLLTTAALTVVMAHVGAPIPCESALLRPVTALLTRMGFDDDLAAHASSFVVEMREAAGILERADSDTLVLIDELGRSTGPLDGAGIAWAILEEIIFSRASCMFVTHMHELLGLADAYPQVVLPVAMQVDVIAGGPGDEPAAAASNGSASGGAAAAAAAATSAAAAAQSAGPDVGLGAAGAVVVSKGSRLRPRFSAQAGGSGPSSGYGIAAAAAVGLPRIIVDAAWRIHAELAREGAAASEASFRSRAVVRDAWVAAEAVAKAIAPGAPPQAVTEATDLAKAVLCCLDEEDRVAQFEVAESHCDAQPMPTGGGAAAAASSQAAGKAPYGIGKQAPGSVSVPSPAAGRASSTKPRSGVSQSPRGTRSPPSREPSPAAKRVARTPPSGAAAVPRRPQGAPSAATAPDAATPHTPEWMRRLL